MSRLEVRFDGRAALFDGTGERVPNVLWLVRGVLGSQVTDGATPVRAEREGGIEKPVEVGSRGGRHGHIFHAELSRVAVSAHRQFRALTAADACVCRHALGRPSYAEGVVEGRHRGSADRRADMGTLPWRSRPRETLREVLAGPLWRIVIFPYVFAPLMIWKLLGPLWNGPKTSRVDWLVLIITLAPWVFLAVWLQRPASSRRRSS